MTTKKLLFIDTETTGLIDPKPIQIFQMGLVVDTDKRELTLLEDVRCNLEYNPGKPIEITASAVHGYFDSDMVDRPLYTGYEPVPDVIYVGHHIRFDLEVLGLYKDGKSSVPFICTKALAKELFPELGSNTGLSTVFALLASRSSQDLSADKIRDILRSAHDARYDALMTSFIFKEMAKMCDDIFALAEKTINDPLCSTAKHLGKRMSEVFKTDRQYVTWYMSDKNTHKRTDHTEVWARMIAEEVRV